MPADIATRPAARPRDALLTFPADEREEKELSRARARSVESSDPVAHRHRLLRRLLRRLHGRPATDQPQAPRQSSPSLARLPHHITERHGGRELWVTAPRISDLLEMQRASWPKARHTRLVVLNGRTLSCFAISRRASSSRAAHSPDGSTEPASASMASSDIAHGRLCKRLELTADVELRDLDDRTFSLTSRDDKPWVLRAPDIETQRKWCRALTDSIDFARWLQHYQVRGVLGVGGHGVVKQFVDTRTNQQYALKVVHAARFRDRAAIVAEVDILRNITNDIRHPNLVRIHKVFEERDQIHLMLDLCAGGELYRAIVQRGHYSERDAARLMHQLMSALQALHRHNILHLDLKPENILLTSTRDDAQIVLTDFGLARMVSRSAHRDDELAGTVGFMAPEVIAAHEYSPAADVFSAGVILFILLVGYPPFTGDSAVEVLLKTARGDFQLDPTHWSGISTSAKELVARMLEVRAVDRISVDDVLQHPWLADADEDFHDQSHGEGLDNDTSDTTELRETTARMQRFNALRKTQNMGHCMAAMLGDASREEYLALVDVQAIELLIRQISPTSSGRVRVDTAQTLARDLGVSRHVDAPAFVAFLDRNGDGFIDANDFCDGVTAMRDGHEAFAQLIFAALQRVATSKTSEKETATSDPTNPTNLTHGLTRRHFVCAFEVLACPDDLATAFLRYLDDHAASPAAISIDPQQFATLFRAFPFLGLLFMRKAKHNVMAMTRSQGAGSTLLAEFARECARSDEIAAAASMTCCTGTRG